MFNRRIPSGCLIEITGNDIIVPFTFESLQFIERVLVCQYYNLVACVDFESITLLRCVPGARITKIT